MDSVNIWNWRSCDCRGRYVWIQLKHRPHIKVRKYAVEEEGPWFLCGHFLSCQDKRRWLTCATLTMARATLARFCRSSNLYSTLVMSLKASTPTRVADSPTSNCLITPRTNLSILVKSGAQMLREASIRKSTSASFPSQSGRRDTINLFNLLTFCAGFNFKWAGNLAVERRNVCNNEKMV